MFAYRDARGRAEVAFTDRHGGVSAGPFGSLNLQTGGADDPAAVVENLRRVALALAGDDSGSAPPVALMRQVHGADVAVVDGPVEPLPEADALVTARPGLLLVVRVADCVPVLLADAERGVVAAAHAGRPGVAAGVVPRALAAMRDLGARRITAWIGPHVCGRCYEVPEAMREEVAALVPESRAETSWGTPALDLGAAVRAQLEAGDAEVVDASRCTREHDDLFSYRRQGSDSGRLAGLVWVRP